MGIVAQDSSHQTSHLLLQYSGAGGQKETLPALFDLPKGYLTATNVSSVSSVYLGMGNS